MWSRCARPARGGSAADALLHPPCDGTHDAAGRVGRDGGGSAAPRPRVSDDIHVHGVLRRGTSFVDFPRLCHLVAEDGSCRVPLPFRDGALCIRSASCSSRSAPAACSSRSAVSPTGSVQDTDRLCPGHQPRITGMRGSRRPARTRGGSMVGVPDACQPRAAAARPPATGALKSATSGSVH